MNLLNDLAYFTFFYYSFFLAGTHYRYLQALIRVVLACSYDDKSLATSTSYKPIIRAIIIF